MLVVFAASFFSNLSVAKASSLNASPKVCVVSEQQEFCDLELKFKWQLSEPSDVCLYQQDTQLQCWQGVKKGQFSYKARVQVETIYSLINPLTGVSLASVQVEVQTAYAKKKHRLRSPWSFF
ncbi:DUF3019 domain-containing protein [Pseudoalteromonas sp. US3C1013]|uniref:DUF3019 domain-containing protein n=1 Tax=unclassified Pseudoalteromonas TaxID=194690 RepID=UPI003AB12F95